MTRNYSKERRLAWLGLILALLTAPVSAAELLFRNPQTLVERPTDLAAADLDGDGDLDVVLATRVGDRISIHFNQGDGRMGPEVQYVSGNHPRNVATGDMDADGDPDIIVSNFDDQTLAILMNNGDGTFADASMGAAAYPVAASARQMEVVDIDGDGTLDIVVAHGVGSVGVLFNDGTGVLSEETLLGIEGIGIDVADVNGDGEPDVVAVRGSLSVVLNDGASGFGTPTVITVDSRTRMALGLGDLDGDGDVDAVTANTLPGEVEVWHNDGSGNFTLGPTYDVGEFGYLIEVVDLNADGALDVVLTGGVDHVGVIKEDGFASVLLNDGAGGLLPPDTCPLFPLVQGLATGDFDGDGHLDVATAGNPEPIVPGTLMVLLGDGTGNVGGHRQIPLSSSAEPHSIVAGDLDADGDPDLVVNDTRGKLFATFMQDGGAFAPGPVGRYDDFVFNTAAPLVLADIDRDADLDIVFAGRFRLGVGENLGEGRFDTGRVDWHNGFVTGMASADIAGNSAPDLVFLTASGFAEIAPNDGTGEFDYSGSLVSEVPERSRHLAVGDVDLDGDLDVVTTNRLGEVSLVRNLGGGNLDTAVALPELGRIAAAVLQDLDGDAAPELILSDTDGGVIWVFPNPGDGSFGPRTSYPIGERPFSIATGDLDLDGTIDLAVIDQGVGVEVRVLVLLGDGAGGLTPAGAFQLDRGTTLDDDYGTAIVMIDLDRDGDLDLAVANAGDSNVSLLENRAIRPEAEAAILGPFGSLSTDTEADGATPTDPLETTVQTPGGGFVRISEGPVSADAPRGFSFFGHEAQIEAPPASVANPLVVTFEIDASAVPPGKTASNVFVFRDSMLLGACLGAPGAADPDPCVSSRVDAVDGDVVIEVRTSHASRWNLGVHDPLNYVIAADVNSALGVDRLVFSIPAWKWELLIDQLFDLDQDGAESMAAESEPMEAAASGELLGDVVMRLRSPSDPPFQPSIALLEEPFNQFPYLLEVPPFAPGTGGELSLSLFLELELPQLQLVAHNEQPLTAQGAVGAWPPFLDQPLFGGQAVSLFDDQGDPTNVSIGGLSVAVGLESPPPQVQDLLWTPDKTSLAWSDEINAVSFNIYEGHGSLLQGLVADAPDAANACLHSVAQVPSVGGLTTTPVAGELIWYLVAPVGPFEEGGVGRTRLGPRRLDSAGACESSCAHVKCETGVALVPACDVSVAGVCEFDAFCCEDSWDALCVEEVRTAAGSLACAESQGSCAHTLCVAGAPLAAGCDTPPLAGSCVAAICDADSFCCGADGGTWDALCIEAATSLCGYNCN